MFSQKNVSYTVVDRGLGLVLCNSAQMRGIVCLDDEMHTPLWPGAPYDEEYIEQLPRYSLANMTAHVAHEGTEVRLFLWNNEWLLSTLRCVDADTSVWGSVLSHRALFERALSHGYGIDFDDFVETLDAGHMYVFFLKNYERNRVVNFCAPYPELYHVSTHSSMTDTVSCNIGIRKQPQLFDTDLLARVQNCDPYWSQGVILVGSERRVKILNRQYAMLERLRGGESCVVQRYLALRATDDITVYTNLYSEHDALFKCVERRIKAIEQMFVDEYYNQCENERHTLHSLTADRIIKAVRRRVQLAGGDAGAHEIAQHVKRELLKLCPAQLYKLL